MRRSSHWIVLFLAILSCLGCASSNPERGPEVAKCCKRASGVGPGEGGLSLSTEAARSQVLKTLWQTDGGDKIEFSQIGGDCRIVALFYASCHIACPITVEKLQAVERSLSEADRSRVEFVLITFDPQSDSVEALRGFRREHRLSSRFHLLRGSANETQAVADMLGVTFVKPPLRRAHSNQVSVLDRAGNLLFQDTELHGGARPLVRSISAAMPPIASR